MDSIVHDKLLEVFMTVDDGGDGHTVQALDGVRRAQIILATFYLINKQDQYAKKIHEDFAEETHKRLWSLQQELLNVSNREFWEVSERGTNFTYMNQEQKAQLSVFFSLFKNFLSDQEVPMDPIEKRKHERKQMLMNFD